MKKLIFSILVFFSFNMIVIAEETNKCSNEEILRLRDLAGATQITYELKQYEPEEAPPFMAFEVTVTGFQPDFYVLSNYGVYLKSDLSKVTSAYPFTAGETYQLPFYASEKSFCEGDLILTKTISLPPYNIYSQDSLCEGYEDYELCKKFSPIKFSSYEDFKQRMEQYINSLDKEEPKPSNNNNPNEEQNLFTNLIAFFLKYHLYFLVPIIILGITGIVIIELKKRRSIL